MSSPFQRLKKALTFSLEWIVIVAVALLILDVVWGVITRYAMGEQAKWTEELARFLLIWISLLGGALAFGNKAHLGLDILVGVLHPKSQKLMTLCCHLVVLIFSGTILLYGGGQLVLDTFAMEQRTPALGLLMGHVYLALPMAGAAIAFYSLENLVESLRDEQPPHGEGAN